MNALEIAPASKITHRWGDVEPHTLCRAIVIIPARNEEASLCDAFEALRNQVDRKGEPLDARSFEVLVLLNNCTDGSAQATRRYQRNHPDFPLRMEEHTLEPEVAHAGTARRILMDQACERLERKRTGMRCPPDVILSTDADTVVARDWITANLAAIDRGAEVVGGVIHLFEEDLAALGAGTRRAYERDRVYQSLVAKLEALLDPDPADPWPRHLEHFGASLACTTDVYRRAGGMPAVKPLEDVAFVTALRKVGARIRHAPEVTIFTSARLTGRSEVGLSGQLRHWQRQHTEGAPQIVDSAEWLQFRFRTLSALRRLNESDSQVQSHLPHRFAGKIECARSQRLLTPQFFERIHCDTLIEEMYRSEIGSARHEEINEAITKLKSQLGLIRLKV